MTDACCTFSYNNVTCYKKDECHICHQCDGHCPGHTGVDEWFLKKRVEKKPEPATKPHVEVRKAKVKS